MTGGSASKAAPVLVLGLGNPLLRDDGVGLRLLEAVQARLPASCDGVECLDGGTQGIALIGELCGRYGVVILDAIGLGCAPGTIHVLRDGEISRLRTVRASTAHEGNALEMIATARLLGDEPRELVIVGVEPGEVRTAVGLSNPVEAAVDRAAATAYEIVTELRCRANVSGCAR